MHSMRSLHKPTVWAGPIAQAEARAGAQREPLWVPAGTFVDDRGWSVMNLLVGAMSPGGQCNYSVQHPGVIKAWHRHGKQTDFWFCASGHIKIGVFDQESGRGWVQVVGERAPGVMVIPPPLWHGAATAGGERAGLFYYVTRAYDPADPDEERMAFDAVDGFPWSVRHG
jgi:dTDP-4-dehydrorhamnose 3,5-epimerase